VVVVVTGAAVVLVEVARVVVTGLGVVGFPGLPVALAARRDETDVHAAFLLKLES